jgi:TonB-linked SusC/RagA family outer membrane protein
MQFLVPGVRLQGQKSTLTKPFKLLRIMKLTALFLLTLSLHVSARSDGQTVTLREKNAPLENVLFEIGKQTGYNFIVSDDVLRSAKKVTIDVKNASLKEALEICFKDQPFSFTVNGASIIVRRDHNKVDSTFSDVPFATDTMPRIPVSGRVILKDSTDVALDNVNIMTLTSNEGTTTGPNGQFTILARPGDVLEFTFVGLTTRRMTLSNTTSIIVIKMERAVKTEEEVVVYNTGYESLPKERATGSFVKMNNELVNYRVSMNILDRMNGLANSVYFDNRTNTNKISIRGISTIFSNTDPLIVVDNFPYEGDIGNINPNDVEDITILRDAAATSIWGARAGNGVVVITTKKAKFGQPMLLTANNFVTVTEKPDLYYFPQMSSSSFIDLEQFLFEKGYYNSAINNTTSRPILSPVVEILNRKRSGLITDAEAESQIDALRNLDLRSDFEKYVYRNGTTQQHSLQLSGSGTNIAYMLSVGYDRNLQQQVGNQYDRFTVTTGSTLQPIRGLEISSSIRYALTNKQNNGLRYPLSPGGGKSALYPYARLADENGKPLAIEKDYRMSYVDSAGDGRLLDWHYRPLDEIELADNTVRLQDIVMNFISKYKFSGSVSAQLQYQLEKAKGTSRNYNGPETYFTRNLINRFTQIEGQTITRIVPLGGILDISENELTAQILRGQIDFNNSWKGGDYELNALVGAELRQNRNTSYTGRTYGYNENKLSFSNIDYVSRFPIYGKLSGNSAIPNNVGFGDLLDRFVSVFGNAALNFKKRYTISASARKDAANIFGVNTNDKWKPLWSVGSSWMISNESFYSVNWLSQLRLRATFGYSGNVNNSKSAHGTISYSSSPDPYTQLTHAYVNNPPNPSLRWEESKILNLAVDFAAFKHRISGSIEYYTKESRDLIAPAPLDPTTGISSMDVNSAHISGRGVDVQLNTLNVNKTFKWSSTLIFSFSENKITRYLRPSGTARSYAGSGLTVTPIEGKHAYAVFSYAWAGLDENGNPQGLLNKQQLSTDYNAIQSAPVSDLAYHGSALPLYFGSLVNTFKWKSISCTIFMKYAFAYYFRRGTIDYNSLFSSWASAHADFDKRWQQPGDEKLTTVPALIYPASSSRDEFYKYSEATIEKGDHIRIQNVRISYSISKRHAEKVAFRNIEIILFGDNLGIIWRKNRAGLDPDYYSGYFPAAKSLSIGLKADF